MVLTNEKVKLFYELWIPLLDYVNKKHHLIKSLYGMTDSHGLPLESVHVISCKLWEDVSVIEEYLDKNSEMLPEHKEIIREWKKVVRGAL